jgi:hypothetical protein
MLEPRARANDPPVPRVHGGHQRPHRHAREKEAIDRGEGRARIVPGQDKEQQVVIEGLDRVFARVEDEIPAALLERRPQLGEDKDEEPEQQEVPDNPADMGQSPAKHDEREEPE